MAELEVTGNALNFGYCILVDGFEIHNDGWCTPLSKDSPEVVITEHPTDPRKFRIVVTG